MFIEIKCRHEPILMNLSLLQNCTKCVNEHDEYQKYTLAINMVGDTHGTWRLEFETEEDLNIAYSQILNSK